VKLQSKILLLIIPVIVLPLFWLGLTAYVKLKEHSIESSLGHMSTLLDQVSRGAQSHFAMTYANIELFVNTPAYYYELLSEKSQDILDPAVKQTYNRFDFPSDFVSKSKIERLIAILKLLVSF